MEKRAIYTRISEIAINDANILKKKNEEYGESWKKRGGVGAFMMLARKWDRIEEAVKRHNYDVLEAGSVDSREEGILDDIGDLRRYLLLVEEEIRHQKTSNSEALMRAMGLSEAEERKERIDVPAEEASSAYTNQD